MSEEFAQSQPSVEAHQPGRDAVTSLSDPRAVQILTTEHSSLASARSLVYNEAFTRGDMFLGFLATSFVGLALLAQVLPIDRDFLVVVALVLAFDLVVGLTTYGRIVGANAEDYRAIQGMARIRHGYTEVAPAVLRYFTSSTHDDMAGVMEGYGSPPTAGAGAILYALTTSAGMIALIVSMIGGVLALVSSLAFGAALSVSFVISAVTALGVFVALAAMTVRFYTRVQANLTVLFPTSAEGTGRSRD